jgi:hypothetical protein
VKGIKGYRYHPEEKNWSVPFEALEAILNSKEFPQTQRLNGIGILEEGPLDREAALDVIRQNPFAAPEEAIAGVVLDLVVRLIRDKRRLKVVPRLGSDAHKVVKRFPGATYSAFEGGYSLPSEKLGELLKKLRDKRLLFAVDAEAGAALSESAPLRNEIVKHPHNYSGEDFARALLVPFIVPAPGETNEFRPCFFTTEQFKLAFPGAQRRGGEKPYTVDERGLLRIVGRLPSLAFPVWMDRSVHAFVEERKSSLVSSLSADGGTLDDAAADLVDLPLLWRLAPSGRGALVADRELSPVAFEMVAARVAELAEFKLRDEPRRVVIEVPDSKLLAAMREGDLINKAQRLPGIPRSEGFEQLEKDVVRRTRLIERTGYYSELDDLDAESIEGLPRDAAARLFPHQRVAVSWLLENPAAFLGDDMGLGKTLSVLSYFTALKAKAGFQLLMVVCPNSLTRNWLREISVWFPELRGTVLAGDKSGKSWALRLLTTGAMEFDVLVVNYEGVRLEYVTPELERLADQRKTLLCLDESQRVKNHQSKTFQAITSIAPKSERRVLLSGTPTPKDVTDLWAQMRVLDGGERFGKSFYKWLGTVAELGNDYSEFAVKKFHPEAVQESITRVHEIMLRRRKERVVNLPEKTFTVREIELTGSQRERYDEIREGLILRMRSLSGEQFVRSITNILEEYLRAVQVASNPRLIDPDWKGTPVKFAELDEIVEEVVREDEQKIVIWTNYLGNVRELTERYAPFGSAAFSGEVAASEREQTVRAFQEKDSPRVLVAVPAAGGVGITLTAAQTAVYVDKTWNAEHWMQSVDRIHRIGQRGTVNIISLLGCKVDELIHWNLRRKERAQREVLGDDRQRGGGDNDDVLTREELLKALEG